jgi:hypothetical protein
VLFRTVTACPWASAPFRAGENLDRNRAVTGRERLERLAHLDMFFRGAAAAKLRRSPDLFPEIP